MGRETDNHSNEARAVLSPRLSGPARVIHLLVLDVMVLAELAVAVGVANAWRERYDFTLVFCAVFFGLLFPTFWLSRLLVRRLLRRSGA